MDKTKNKNLIVLLYVPALILLLWLIIPIIYQYIAVFMYPKGVLSSFGNTRILTALWLSISSAFVTTFLSIVLGVPLGYLFATKDFRGKSIFETLSIDVPQTFPPVAEGMIFLLMLGPNSPFQINFAFTFLALVIAKFYVSAPFIVSYTARKFGEIKSTGINLTARSLGATPFQVFLTIFLPLGLKDIGAGASLCWARAMGELGGSIVFAGVIPFKTEVIPTFIATQASSLTVEALVATILATTTSIIALASFKYLAR